MNPNENPHSPLKLKTMELAAAVTSLPECEERNRISTMALDLVEQLNGLEEHFEKHIRGSDQYDTMTIQVRRHFIPQVGQMAISPTIYRTLSISIFDSFATDELKARTLLDIMNDLRQRLELEFHPREQSPAA